MRFCLIMVFLAELDEVAIDIIDFSRSVMRHILIHRWVMERIRHFADVVDGGEFFRAGIQHGDPIAFTNIIGLIDQLPAQLIGPWLGGKFTHRNFEEGTEGVDHRVEDDFGQ